MSLKRYNGSAWVDVESVKRYSGSAWVDCESVKRYTGSAWVEVWSNTQMLSEVALGSKIKTPMADGSYLGHILVEKQTTSTYGGTYCVLMQESPYASESLWTNYFTLPGSSSTYATSQAREMLINSYLPLYSSAMRGVIQSAAVQYRKATSGTETTSDKIWLLSPTELGGSDTVTLGMQFSYFTSNTARDQFYLSGTSKAYHTREVCYGDGPDGIMTVSASGTITETAMPGAKNPLRPCIALLPTQLVSGTQDTNGYYTIEI